MPQDVANSLLKIYANLYRLTVSDETQLQKAFFAASPDDIVQNAQLPSKGMSLTLLRSLISGAIPPWQVDTQKPKVENMALEIKSVDLNDENGAQTSSKARIKTLEDIKTELTRQKKSTVSFVIIGW